MIPPGTGGSRVSVIRSVASSQQPISASFVHQCSNLPQRETSSHPAGVWKIGNSIPQCVCVCVCAEIGPEFRSKWCTMIAGAESWRETERKMDRKINNIFLAILRVQLRTQNTDTGRLESHRIDSLAVFV